MLDSLGQVLLRGGPVGNDTGDDTSLAFTRIEGDPAARTLCFLPWRMPFRLAQSIGLVPRPFLACYEMPAAIVSSEPALCIAALERVQRDARDFVAAHSIPGSAILVVGLSIGNAAATYFANSIGARLYSIASADRGDLTLWESPASRLIKHRAEAKGYTLDDFTQASRGYNSIENLQNLAPGSRFVVGLRDELVPKARRDGLVSAVKRTLPSAEITHLDVGHIGTMVDTVRRGLVRELPQADPPG